jgi:predicted HTH domain antitoxin
MMDQQPIIADKLSLAIWELQQLVKAGLYPDEQTALRSALRALFKASPQTKIRMVISAYEAGDISLGKAAAMLGVSQEEMKDILREAVSEIHLGPQTAEELLEDARNA